MSMGGDRTNTRSSCPSRKPKPVVMFNIACSCFHSCPTMWLSRLWPDWQSVLQFVQPRTVIAWQHERFREHWRHLSQRGTPGRPVLAKEVRDLLRQMWQANPTWGSPRIVGELRKLESQVA